MKVVDRNREDITVDEIITAAWEEYRHAYGLLESRRLTTTFLQASGHAQCALSLLAQFGEDTSKQHQDMADVMAFVIGIEGGT